VPTLSYFCAIPRRALRWRSSPRAPLARTSGTPGLAPVSRHMPHPMSRRLAVVAWRETKPRVFPTFLCGLYALVIRLNVDAWRSHDQFFVERDPSLSYPALTSTVKTWPDLVITCSVLPFVVILLLSVWAHHRLPNSDAPVAWYFQQSFALGNTLLITMGTYNAGKCFVGRLRPNFFAACDYYGYGEAVGDGSNINTTLMDAYLAATAPGAVGDLGNCRASVDDTDEASLSFPSGHAAIAFAGMSRVSLSLLGVGWLIGGQEGIREETSEDATTRDSLDSQRKCLRITPSDIVPYPSWYFHSLSAAPIAYACYIAASRIADYKHRPADVAVGALVGIVAAIGCDAGSSLSWFEACWRKQQSKRSTTNEEFELVQDSIG